MITVGMNYDILPGKELYFEQVFAKVLEIMKGMSGHKESHLYRDVARPQSYLILSEWTDPQAFQAFIGSQQFRNVADWGREQVLASRPKHEIYGMDKPLAPPEAAAGRCPAPH